MQSILPQNNTIPSFSGINKNVKIARTEIHKFHEKFGCPHSDSFICLKIYKHKDDEKFTPLMQGLMDLAIKYAHVMRKEYWNQYLTDRFKFLIEQTKPAKKLFYKNLKANVKRTKVANCDQQADILNYQFKQRGINSQIVNLTIINKDSGKRRSCGAHSFVVIGMSKQAKIENPETWGKNAVVADAWTNQAEPAETGLKYLLEFFNFNPQKECIEFEKPSNFF